MEAAEEAGAVMLPVLKRQAHVILDLPYVLGLARDWAEARHLRAGERVHLDLFRVIDAIERRFDVKRVVVYDLGPADGGEPPNHEIHKMLQDHPRVLLHVEPGIIPPGRRKRHDTRIAADAFLGTIREGVRDVVLISGDEDFVPVVAGLQLLGARVTVACSLFLRNAKNLRLQADEAIDLDDEATVILNTEPAAP